MAEAALGAGLKALPLVAEHYDKVTDPLQNKAKQGIYKVKSMRNGGNRGGYSDDEYDEYDRYGPPQRRQTDRRRSPRDDFRDRDRRRDRDRGELVEDRYAYQKSGGRARSVGGRDDRRRGNRRDYSDSESSLSPPRRERRKSLGEKALVALGLGSAGAAAEKSHRSRSRERRKRESKRDRSRRRDYTPSSDSEGYFVRKAERNRNFSQQNYNQDRTPDRYRPAGYIQDRGDGDRGRENNQQLARRDANNNSAVGSRSNAQSEHRGQKRDSSSSSSFSDASCSSSEDERRTKKMKGKEYLTAGLAAVATIHAAHGVYSSMEARDKRHMDVMTGEISPEEARKKKNKARMQDAAAIGIAALGIKGAYSEWQEVQEHRNELSEQNKHRKERHEKRVKKMEKEKRKNGGGGGYGGGGYDDRGGYGRSRSEGPGRRDRDRDYSR